MAEGSPAKLKHSDDGERHAPPTEPALVYLDRTWSQLTFLVVPGEDAMKQLTPVYTQAWADRKAALLVKDDKERTAKVAEIRQTLVEKLTAVLSDDQLAQLQAPAFGPPPPPQ